VQVLQCRVHFHQQGVAGSVKEETDALGEVEVFLRVVVHDRDSLLADGTIADQSDKYKQNFFPDIAFSADRGGEGWMRPRGIRYYRAYRSVTDLARIQSQTGWRVGDVPGTPHDSKFTCIYLTNQLLFHQQARNPHMDHYSKENFHLTQSVGFFL